MKIKKVEYCKECHHYHNGSHTLKYYNWCTHFGKSCKDAIGNCKLNKSRIMKNET